VQILRGLVVVVASTISLIVLTAILVYSRMRIEMPEVKAIGLSLVKEWTLYSPIYWILVLAFVWSVCKLFKTWWSPLILDDRPPGSSGFRSCLSIAWVLKKSRRLAG
jgi:hypothetical protein